MSTSCKVRCFYFFVLNAAIRMTISSSTAPTSTIPKPLDVSHIQIVAAQTILRFSSILTLLISLPWGDGRLLDTGGGGRTRTHDFNPLPSCEGRPNSADVYPPWTCAYRSARFPRIACSANSAVAPPVCQKTTVSPGRIFPVRIWSSRPASAFPV